jgi:hypothetical protein
MTLNGTRSASVEFKKDSGAANRFPCAGRVLPVFRGSCPSLCILSSRVLLGLRCSLVHNSLGETDAECSDYFGLGPGNCAVGRPSYLNIDLINLFGRLGPETTHVVLRRRADVQRIDRSSAGLNATKDDPFRLRCRGRRMHEDRRICGARFGYSLACRQEVEDGGESASPFKTYRGRPPQLAASFISNVTCWPFADRTSPAAV